MKVMNGQGIIGAQNFSSGKEIEITRAGTKTIGARDPYSAVADFSEAEMDLVWFLELHSRSEKGGTGE
jgi:hypothetical protein